MSPSACDGIRAGPIPCRGGELLQGDEPVGCCHLSESPSADTAAFCHEHPVTGHGVQFNPHAYAFRIKVVYGGVRTKGYMLIDAVKYPSH